MLHLLNNSANNEQVYHILSEMKKIFKRKNNQSFAVLFSGATLHEIFVLREGRFKRIPDVVVWPSKKCFIPVMVTYVPDRRFRLW